ncbi:hypothetical protein LSH36_313g00006 [Paralvinella palmiformis]|uniref:Reverse transcriptase domain-containing protein n=1 Tax=Paralvinella palmiformis TaxID=53620 RepID=A0AAD9JIT1_9ANNE|nr:hypothetical protein LSH36_313g00006 [Paralvinella palmiformis]
MPETVYKVKSLVGYRCKAETISKELSKDYNTQERECKYCNNKHRMKKEECSTCANKRATLLSSISRKAIEELTRGSILSLTTRQMQLITVNAENFDKIAAVDISNNYDDVFDASTIGTLGTHHHLEITNVLWVNQLVITLKDTGAVRVCIDPRELNKSLLREHYTLLILDETLHQIGQSRVFSPVDLSSEYWHVVLDKESSLLTTFQTPFGRYRRCRLPFGTCSSADILQKKLLDALEGLPGVTCIVDDVLIHANTTEKHHQLFLKRCQETGIKSHKSKLQL